MGGLGGVKNGCKRGCGTVTRREQGFFVLEGGGHFQCLTGSKVSSGMLITCGPYPWL